MNLSRRVRGSIAFAVGLLVAVCPTSSLAAEEADGWRWSGVPRVVAVGDIHGAYENLELILRATRLIDEQGSWIGGEAQFVSLGDVVDRGPDSRRVFDLLMRLDVEAREAGGRVHLILGNHEVMNLVGDRRFVTAEEYRAFAEEESPDDRERAYQRFVVDETDSAEARARFEKRYPTGFFGHLRAFSPEGRYGSWLLRQPALIVIDEAAFVHGGLPPAVAELGAAELNRRLLAELREYFDVVARLVEGGVLTPESEFKERGEIVAAYLERADEAVAESDAQSSELVEESSRYLEFDGALAFGFSGPLWYRGAAYHAEVQESPILEAALSELGAKFVVVGHTPTPNRRIRSRFDGRVLLIDTGMQVAHYTGHPAALLIEDGEVRAFYPEEDLTEPPQPLADSDAAPPVRSDEEIEKFLASAEITLVEAIGTGVTNPKRLTLKLGDLELRAVYKTVDETRSSVDPTSLILGLNESDRYTYDIVAYRLDRLLGLNMVPVAVERVIDGEPGVVQIWVEDAITEGDRLERGLQPPDQASFNRQVNLMRIFDVLIYNSDRNAGNILYTQDWRVHLIDHSRAFRLNKGRPADLRDKTLTLTPELAEALTRLDKKVLREALKGLVHSMQIDALLRRQKKLLKDWEKTR